MDAMWFQWWYIIGPQTLLEADLANILKWLSHNHNNVFNEMFILHLCTSSGGVLLFIQTFENPSNYCPNITLMKSAGL